MGRSLLLLLVVQVSCVRHFETVEPLTDTPSVPSLSSDVAIRGKTELSVQGTRDDESVTVALAGVPLSLNDKRFILPMDTPTGLASLELTVSSVVTSVTVYVFADSAKLHSARNESGAAEGVGGDRVFLQGAHFDPRTPANNVVTLGDGTVVPVLSAGETVLLVQLPDDAHAPGATDAVGGDISFTVTVAKLTDTPSNSVPFLLLGQPQLQAISPPMPVPDENVLLFFSQPPSALLGGQRNAAELEIRLGGALATHVELQPLEKFPGRPADTLTIIQARSAANLPASDDQIVSVRNRRGEATLMIRIGLGGDLLGQGHATLLSDPEDYKKGDVLDLGVPGSDDLLRLVRIHPKARRVSYFVSNEQVQPSEIELIGPPAVRVVPGAGSPFFVHRAEVMADDEGNAYGRFLSADGDFDVGLGEGYVLCLTCDTPPIARNKIEHGRFFRTASGRVLLAFMEFATGVYPTAQRVVVLDPATGTELASLLLSEKYFKEDPLLFENAGTAMDAFFVFRTHDACGLELFQAHEDMESGAISLGSWRKITGPDMGGLEVCNSLMPHTLQPVQLESYNAGALAPDTGLAALAFDLSFGSCEAVAKLWAARLDFDNASTLESSFVNLPSTCSTQGTACEAGGYCALSRPVKQWNGLLITSTDDASHRLLVYGLGAGGPESEDNISGGFVLSTLFARFDELANGTLPDLSDSFSTVFDLPYSSNPQEDWAYSTLKPVGKRKVYGVEYRRAVAVIPWTTNERFAVTYPSVDLLRNDARFLLFHSDPWNDTQKVLPFAEPSFLSVTQHAIVASQSAASTLLDFRDQLSAPLVSTLSRTRTPGLPTEMVVADDQARIPGFVFHAPPYAAGIGLDWEAYDLSGEHTGVLATGHLAVALDVSTSSELPNRLVADPAGLGLWVATADNAVAFFARNGNGLAASSLTLSAGQFGLSTSAAPVALSPMLDGKSIAVLWRGCSASGNQTYAASIASISGVMPAAGNSIDLGETVAPCVESFPVPPFYGSPVTITVLRDGLIVKRPQASHADLCAPLGFQGEFEQPCTLEDVSRISFVPVSVGTPLALDDHVTHTDFDFASNSTCLSAAASLGTQAFFRPSSVGDDGCDWLLDPGLNSGHFFSQEVTEPFSLSRLDVATGFDPTNGRAGDLYLAGARSGRHLGLNGVDASGQRLFGLYAWDGSKLTLKQRLTFGAEVVHVSPFYAGESLFVRATNGVWIYR